MDKKDKETIEEKENRKNNILKVIELIITGLFIFGFLILIVCLGS